MCFFGDFDSSKLEKRKETSRSDRQVSSQSRRGSPEILQEMLSRPILPFCYSIQSPIIPIGSAEVDKEKPYAEG
uniref:Uncharacterized protein n=1 Tax=Vespula pensylvanica TaxID=30213 RepID=A0A834P492_VESPE|nr:hypothetical protein H0235_007127 [Vespula pensylvanica]